MKTPGQQRGPRKSRGKKSNGERRSPRRPRKRGRPRSGNSGRRALRGLKRRQWAMKKQEEGAAEAATPIAQGRRLDARALRRRTGGPVMAKKKVTKKRVAKKRRGQEEGRQDAREESRPRRAEEESVHEGRAEEERRLVAGQTGQVHGQEARDPGPTGRSSTSAMAGREPKLEVPTRSASNTRWNKSRGILQMGSRRTRASSSTSGRRASSCRRCCTASRSTS